MTAVATAPRTDGAVPRIDGAVPRIDGAVPRIDSAVPRADGLRPQERASLSGTIAAADCISAGLSAVCRCVLTGAHGELDLLFLGRASIAGLTVGIRCTAAGTVTVHCGRLAIWNPRYQVRP